jgi:hypothetical protein
MCENRSECAESLDKLAHSTYQTRTAQTVTSGMQSAVLSSNRRARRGVTAGPRVQRSAQTLSACAIDVSRASRITENGANGAKAALH